MKDGVLDSTSASAQRILDATRPKFVYLAGITRNRMDTRDVSAFPQNIAQKQLSWE